MKRLRMTATGLAVVFLATSLASAQPYEGWDPDAQSQKGRLPQELNLKTEQQAKLLENRKLQRAETKKIYGKIKEKQAQLQKEMEKPGVSRAALEPLVKELKELHGQLVENRVKGIFAVKEILTPEQFVKFNQMTRKRHDKMKENFRPRNQRKKALQAE